MPDTPGNWFMIFARAAPPIRIRGRREEIARRVRCLFRYRTARASVPRETYPARRVRRHRMNRPLVCEPLGLCRRA